MRMEKRGLEKRSRHVASPATTLVAISIAVILTIFYLGCATTGDLAADSTDDPASDRVGDDTTTDERVEIDTIPEPLFTITGVVLQVQRVAPRTVIILPPASFISDYLRDEPFTLPHRPREPLQANRFLLRFNLNTTSAPPFVAERDRFLYPDLYD